MSDWQYVLNNAALLVIDKQNGYVKRTDRDTSKLMDTVPKIDEFILSLRDLGIPVVWTKMLENETDSPANIAEKIKQDPHKGGGTFLNTPSYEIFGKVQPSSDEKVIDKQYFDAFAKTDLAGYLKSRSVETIILVGGYTSRCILGTAYGANGHGLNVLVVSDLVGNPAEFADEGPYAIKVIDSILGYSKNSSEILEALHRLHVSS